MPLDASEVADATYPWLLQHGIIPPKVWASTLLSMLSLGYFTGMKQKPVEGGESGKDARSALPWLLDWLYRDASLRRQRGFALLGLGLSVALLSRYQFRSESAKIMTAKQSCLVKHGFFSLCRNPMYCGMTMILMSVAAFFPSRLNFAMPLVFIGIIANTYVPWEERTLEAQFGQEYRDYKATVARWIPFLW